MCRSASGRLIRVMDRVGVLLGDGVFDGVEAGRDFFNTADLDILGAIGC